MRGELARVLPTEPQNAIRNILSLTLCESGPCCNLSLYFCNCFVRGCVGKVDNNDLVIALDDDIIEGAEFVIHAFLTQHVIYVKD